MICKKDDGEEPYAIYDDLEYDYEIEGNSIVIKELDSTETRNDRCIMPMAGVTALRWSTSPSTSRSARETS